MAAANWQIQLLAYQEKLFIESYEKQKAEWERTFDQAQVLTRELAAIQQKKELWEAVRVRLEQRRMEEKVPGSIEVLARAVVASRAASDRRPILTAIALFLGLGLGVGTGFLRAYGNVTISRAEELSHSAAPFLGQLPEIDTKRGPPVLIHPAINEGTRMIRTALLQRMGNHHGRVVLITSANPGEGKTTVAVALARSLAHCGKRVLLVDADMRNPSLCQRLGMEHTGGLAIALTGKVDDSEVIIRTNVPRLSLLPGGSIYDEIDPELMANGTFFKALRRWRKKYDVVLLDSSPVLPVADSRILSHEADGTILIARADRTYRTDVAEALASLKAAGGRLWGTVFVGSPHRKHYASVYKDGR